MLIKCYATMTNLKNFFLFDADPVKCNSEPVFTLET